MPENIEKTTNIFRVVLLVFLILSIAFITYAVIFNPAPFFKNIMINHFKAVLGLPAASLTSLVLVLLLKQTAGPIEFKGLSFEFKGLQVKLFYGRFVFWQSFIQLINYGKNF